LEDVSMVWFNGLGGKIFLFHFLIQGSLTSN